MKRFFLFLLSVGFAYTGHAQFNNSYTKWDLPAGGNTNLNGHLFGYNAMASGTDWVDNDLGYSTFDINGDKLPDLVVFGEGDGNFGDAFGVGNNPYWRVNLNTGSGFSGNATIWDVPSGGNTNLNGHLFGFNAMASSTDWVNNDLGYATMDIDGDDLPDLVVVGKGDGTYADGFGVGSNPHWRVHLNTGSGFAANYTTWALPSGGNTDQNGHLYGFNAIASVTDWVSNDLGYATADMDGDKKPDLVVFGKGDGTFADGFGVGSNPHWQVYLNTGSGFASNYITWTLPSGGNTNQNGHLFGFNAMGSVTDWVNNDLGYATMDMDGDLLPDLVVFGQGDGSFADGFGVGANPHWRVYRNTGSGFATSYDTWTVPSGGNTDQNGHLYGFNAIGSVTDWVSNDLGYSTTDINNDQLPDLVVFGQGDGSFGDGFGVGNNPHWKVYLNNGTKFVANPFTWTVPAGGNTNQNGHLFGFNAMFSGTDWVLNDLGYATTDMDGNGKPDLVVFGKGDGSFGDSFDVGIDPHWRVYLNATTLVDLQQPLEGGISMYPNPSTGHVNVDLGDAHAEVRLRLLDVSGREVLVREAGPVRSLELNLSVPAGMYFVEVTLDGMVQPVLKLVKR